MSNQPGKFRDDQVLVICPGSKTTVAALGVSELLVPTTRIPTRMFPDPELKNHYIPYHTHKRKKIKPAASDQANGDSKPEEDEYEYVEDPDSDEGAVYPMVGGRIVNMTAFLGFLEHVHSLLTNSYHNTPILLMSSPQWQKRDYEMIAQYIFEKTKTPALCLCMSSVATSYGIGKSPHLTVVDIGYEKVDVTCLYDFCPVSHNCEGFPDVQAPHKVSGGEVFTRKLMEKLQSQNFTHDMAEQLKKSPICEVLPYAPDKEALMDLPVENVPSVATTTTTEGAIVTPVIFEPNRAPTVTTSGAENGDGTEKNGDNDGVLDVASIVVSGQTKEFLAKKDKEKADKAKQKKGKGDKDAQDAGAKPTRLPNSKRLCNVFHYEEIVEDEIMTTKMKEVTIGDSSAPASSEGTTTEVPKPEEPAVPERQIKKIRRDIEVGLERFTFADRQEIDRIVSLIYRTVQEIGDMYMRPACWENLVFVGNGSRLKGLKENIMQTLQARHLVSPSTATIFMSELPSNIGTPSGTGSQTPMRDFNTPPVPNPSNVNPLLQAATTASLQLPRAGDVSSNAGDHRSTHFHSQTPTKIGLAPLPGYLGEWTKHGYEEAMILGSLVCARIAFTSQHADKDTLEHMKTMSLSRVDYNELGPKGIHSHNMLLV